MRWKQCAMIQRKAGKNNLHVHGMSITYTCISMKTREGRDENDTERKHKEGSEHKTEEKEKKRHNKAKENIH